MTPLKIAFGVSVFIMERACIWLSMVVLLLFLGADATKLCLQSVLLEEKE